MIKKPIKYLILLTILTSIVINIITFITTVHYYQAYKISKVFPLNKEYYSSENKKLKVSERLKRVVLFGDSRIREWRVLPEHLPFQFINRGISGETTPQMIGRFQQDVLSLKPDIVVIQAGINDLVTAGMAKNKESKTIIAQCEKNIEYFVNTLNKNKVIVILFSIIPPSKMDILRRIIWGGSTENYVATVNKSLLARNNNEYLYIVNTKNLLMYANNKWVDNVNKDTLHLTDKGYNILNQSLESILRKIDTSPQDSQQ